MTRFSIHIAAFFALALAPFALRAETVPAGGQIGEDSVIREFLLSQTHLQGLARAAAVFDEALGRECAEDSYRISLQRVRVLEQMSMETADTLPSEGAWSARYVAEQCNSPITYNALMKVSAGQLNVEPLVPGQTAFSAPLIQDFLPMVPQLAQIEECEAVYISNIVPGAPRGVQLEGEGLFETWVVQGCDKEVQLVLMAQPGDNPGDTRISLVERIEVGL